MMDTLTLNEFHRVVKIANAFTPSSFGPMILDFILIIDNESNQTKNINTIRNLNSKKQFHWKILNKVRIKGEIVRSKKIIYEETGKYGDTTIDSIFLNDYQIYNSPPLRWPR